MRVREWADFALISFRPHFYWNALWPLLGWAVAVNGASPYRTLSFGAAMAVGAGAMLVLNDVMDAEKDKTTAPGRPLAAGQSTRAQGIVLVTMSIAVMLVLLSVAIGHGGAFALSIVGIVTAVLLGVAYSLVKPLGVVASLVYAMLPISMALLGWYVHGRGDASTLALVLTDILLTALVMNSAAALNDIDSDGLVGNRTLPVRVGAERTISFIFALVVTSVIVECILCVQVGRQLWFVALPIAMGIRNLFDLSRIRASFDTDGYGRAERIATAFPFFYTTMARLLVVLIIVSPPVGIATAAILLVCDVLQRLWIRSRFGQWSLPAGTD